MKTRGRGFTLVDLVVAIGVAGVMSAVGVPVVRMATSDNSLQRCRYNLRTIAQAGGMYKQDFAGQMWALSWQGGTANPEMPWQTFGTDSQGQAWQATLIMRQRAGLSVSHSEIPAGWLAPILFTHLALVDYLDLPLPNSTFACPLDARRMAYVNGNYTAYPTDGGDGTSSTWRAPYTTSYVSSPYQWSPSRQSTVQTSSGPRPTPMFFPASNNVTSWGLDAFNGEMPIGSFRPRQASDVRFPSQKVALADDYARHQGAPRYYAYSDAVQDLQFYDGSVRPYRTDSTNPGWNPRSQTDRKNMRARLTFTKVADFWGGLDNNAQSATFAAGWYRWTRGGLLGWDVPRLSSMVGKPPSANVVENELNTSVGTW